MAVQTLKETNTTLVLQKSSVAPFTVAVISTEERINANTEMWVLSLTSKTTKASKEDKFNSLETLNGKEVIYF